MWVALISCDDAMQCNAVWYICSKLTWRCACLCAVSTWVSEQVCVCMCACALVTWTIQDPHAFRSGLSGVRAWFYSIIFIHISYIISVSAPISYLNLFISPESPEPQLSSKLLKLRPKSCEITLPWVHTIRSVQVRDPDCFEGGARDIESYRKLLEICFFWMRWLT